MEEDTEYKNLPIEDRCVHKLWKARIHGYEACIEIFGAITDEKAPELRKYECLMKKFATDSNAAAYDKALDAILAFVTNAHVSVRTVSDIIAGIVSKALPAPKKTLQDKAVEISLMCVEIEKYEAVQEEIMKGFTHKNPKVIVGCLRVLTSALRDFGHKVISIKLLLKTIGSLLENRDKNVRDETKKMLVEMYRWAGVALKPQLASLKPLQLQELEAEFEKIGNEKVVATRLLRSHQEKQAEIEEETSDGQIEDESAQLDDTGKIDPLDLVEEVNILDQLPKDFYEKIDAKKWQDRKEALDALLTLSQNGKLASGSYGEVVKALKKVIGKDSNVLLVAIAGNCLTGLSKGLRKEFSIFAVSCLDTVLAKFKEKKLIVITSLREAVDAIFQSTNIESMMDVVIASLASKNPNVKSETASFLARAFCYCTPNMLNKKTLKSYATPLLKTLNESDPTVREGSAEALGTVLKIVGEEAMITYLVDIDDLKKKKIKEYSEKADIKVKAPSKPKIAKDSKKNAASNAKKPVLRRPISAKPVPKEKEESQVDSNKEETIENDIDFDDELNGSIDQNKHPTKSLRGRGVPVRGLTRGGGRGSQAKKGSRETSATRVVGDTQKEKNDCLSLLQVNTLKQTRMKDEQKLRTIRWDFTTPRPDFITQLKDQMEVANFSCQMVTQMFHKDFKFHLKAIESLQKDLTENSDACICNLDLILRWLTIRFFDTNPSVMLKALEYLKNVFSFLSESNYNLLDYEVYAFMPYLILKFGDPKVKLTAQNITFSICNIYPASKVSPYILDGLKSKNARQRTVCLETLSSLIETYGMTVCQPTPAASLKEIAKQIADRDNTVRTAALNALVQVYFREGEKVYKYIGTMSPKDLSLLEERIKRSTKNRPVIKKPVSESQSQIVKPQESPNVLNSTREMRGGRVVPTIAQAPPTIRNTPRAASDSQIGGSAKFQINYDFLKKLLNDDVENGNSLNKCNVQLEEVEDIDSILQDNTMYQLSSSRSLKSNLQSVKYTNDNIDDTSTVINSVIAQVANPESEAVIAALCQLEELIKSDDKRIHLYQHVDHLLIATTLQFRAVFNTKMVDSYPNKGECVRVYRSLINCLLSIFQKHELGTRATTDPLRDVIHVILPIIIDPRLTHIEDGAQVIKSLNVLVVRMIENANFTNIFSALLKLLQESVGRTGHSLNGKLTELAMKCNWKAIRTLQSRSKELCVSQILNDVNNFLIMYPTSHPTWADKSAIQPLKTIKTVLHKLVEIYGTDIHNHVSKISNYQDSEIQKYIDKTLAAQKSIKDESINKDSNKLSPNVDKTCSKLPGKRLSKAANETLSEIFKKIGSKENKQEGLHQLYEFREKYPEADIDSFLTKSSPFFQNYIERGLKKIELEIRNTSISAGSAIEASLSSVKTGDPNVHLMIDDFKSLAEQAGFDNTYIQNAIKEITKKQSDNPNADIQ